MEECNMTGKKGKSGGVREGSGRKPLAEKKEPITFYAEPSKIEAVGGKEIAREIAVEALDKAAKKAARSAINRQIKKKQ